LKGHSKLGIYNINYQGISRILVENN